MLNKNEIEIFKKLQAYIDEQYVPPRFSEIDEDDFYDRIFDIWKRDWSKNSDKPKNKFCAHILAHFKEDYEQLHNCCRRACISTDSYMKICDKLFSPSKECVCKMVIAANLNMISAQEFFDSASVSLRVDNKFDIVIRFFLENSIFDFCTINKSLYLLDLPMLSYSFV